MCGRDPKSRLQASGEDVRRLILRLPRSKKA
jgi:hypothetical protein